MKKPTGKLLFAYNTIANMESRNVELEAERDALQKREKAAADIISAVAHIGVDFGYGRFGLGDKHIASAREWLAAGGEER